MDTSGRVSLKIADTFNLLYSSAFAGLGIYFHDWYAVGLVGGSLVVAMLFYVWRDVPRRLQPATRILSAHEKRMKRLRDNGGSHTEAEWRDLCRQYQWRCLACGHKRKLTKDHIIPVSAGGRDDIANLQPLCLECNVKKGTQTIDYRPVSMP